MATKSDMQKDINEFFIANQVLFEVCKIDRLRYFRWLDGLEDWDTLRKANSYVFVKLKLHIDKMRKTWGIMPTEAWKIIMSVSKNSREVENIRERIFDVQECWKNRTKPPRGPE